MSADKKYTDTNNGRLRIHVSPAKRHIWMFAGHLAVVAGAIGLLLPLIPTSPFVIVAAYCYARSSERFYYMLLNNRYFGDHIRHWEENRCLQKHLKILMSVVLILMFAGTILVFIQSMEARILVASLAALIILAVWLIPTCDK